MINMQNITITKIKEDATTYNFEGYLDIIVNSLEIATQYADKIVEIIECWSIYGCSYIIRVNQMHFYNVKEYRFEENRLVMIK
jgi:hypothetical protein